MLLLLPIAENHLPAVDKYAADPCIGATSAVPDPYPPDGATTWYRFVLNRRIEGTAAVFAITESHEFRGVISINDINGEAGRAHLDYWIAVPYQRRGIATKAAALAMGYAKTELKLRTLLSSCLATNAASARVLERNGFAEYGRIAAHLGKFSGQEIRKFRCELVARG